MNISVPNTKSGKYSTRNHDKHLIKTTTLAAAGSGNRVTADITTSMKNSSVNSSSFLVPRISAQITNTESTDFMPK